MNILRFYLIHCVFDEQYGASVDVADLWKFTPLHEATAKGKFDIVKLLLKVCFISLMYHIFKHFCVFSLVDIIFYIFIKAGILRIYNT